MALSLTSLPQLSVPQYGAPINDLTPQLSQLVNNINQGQEKAFQRQTLADIGKGIAGGTLDYNQAAGRLLAAGDRQGAMSLAMLGMNQANQQYSHGRDAINDQFRREESARAQGNADRNFNLQSSRYEEPAQVKTLRAAGIDPASPEGRKALFPRTDTPISATDKKAIFQAEDAIPAVQGTIENLNRALELNDKTFSGFGAGVRGDIASKLPSSIAPKGAMETAEWSKIMGPEALTAMANTLKGATTDFELKKYMEMLGDPSTPATIRKGVIERMKRLAERKLEIDQARVNDLRGGSYFKEGGGSSGVRQAPGSHGGGSAPQGAIQALRSNPSLRDQFEAKYGPGSADAALGGQ